MERILITGASGNVGKAVLMHFKPSENQQVLIASRKPGESTSLAYFDFENLEQSRDTIARTDILFLLRPPHIADVNKYFKPLIALCKQSGVKHIVFLSVQGADKVKFIPHAKIEKLVVQSGIPYTFFRPSYFMQNLTTTFLDEIKQGSIYLPAGTAEFLWVDVNDIGKAIAAVLSDVRLHQNKLYEITGSELFNFYEVCEMLTRQLRKPVKLVSPTPLSYFLHQKRRGVPTSYILVMLLLHYLPRFQVSPKMSDDFTKLTSEKSKGLEQFIIEEKQTFNA